MLFPEGAKGVTPWDFENYTPDVVFFAVGQNDPHNEGHEDFDITDPDYRAKWKNAYKSIILDLRSKYPNATFVLLLTVLCHGEEWDKAVDEIANELNDEKITHFMFTRTGKATPVTQDFLSSMKWQKSLQLIFQTWAIKFGAKS